MGKKLETHRSTLSINSSGKVVIENWGWTFRLPISARSEKAGHISSTIIFLRLRHSITFHWGLSRPLNSGNLTPKWNLPVVIFLFWAMYAILNSHWKTAVQSVSVLAKPTVWQWCKSAGRWTKDRIKEQFCYKRRDLIKRSQITFKNTTSRIFFQIPFILCCDYIRQQVRIDCSELNTDSKLGLTFFEELLGEIGKKIQ